MANTAAVSSHGTLIKRNTITIAELGDITPPPLTRNTTETTTQNLNDETVVLGGIRRRGELKFALNWLPSGQVTHGSVSGLYKAWNDGSLDLYEVDFTDGSVWLFSGYVTNISPKSPTEGKQGADVSIKPTGSMTMTP